jgi:DNA-binding response OmpR family regulator
MRSILALTKRSDMVRPWARDLEGDGVRVITAPDLPAALAAVSEERPDLILVDLTLPGGGVEPGRQLRRVTRAPILLLAGRLEDAEPAIHLGDLTLNLSDRWVAVSGQTVYLTATELELLGALAGDPGRVYTRAELVRALGAEDAISERTVDSHIKNLRAKIEPDPRHPRYIVTVHGLGYRLNP